MSPVSYTHLDVYKRQVREVRLALLAADVNYQVAKDFCEEVKTKALGAEVLALSLIHI